MAQFFDQDNSHTSYSRSNTSSNMGGYEENVNYGNYNNRRYAEQTKNLVRNSTVSSTQKERAKVIKAQQKKQARNRRVATLLVSCMILGGVAVSVANEVIDNIQENQIVYEQTSEFKKDVINPNTHRTYDKQHYYYDYADIAKAIKEEGKDFSTELYKAYAHLGENQTDFVMSYTDYDTVQDYVIASGFDSIDDWVKNERKKIVLQEEINKKNEELNAMHKELNENKSVDTVEDSYTGGK